MSSWYWSIPFIFFCYYKDEYQISVFCRFCKDFGDFLFWYYFSYL